MVVIVAPFYRRLTHNNGIKAFVSGVRAIQQAIRVAGREEVI
jgi:hypothetical protein